MVTQYLKMLFMFVKYLSQITGNFWNQTHDSATIVSYQKIYIYIFIYLFRMDLTLRILNGTAAV
jgi:hypothetical protein